MSATLEADPDSFLAALRRGGVETIASVPCSSMTGLINAAAQDRALLFANAPNEGEALAFAAGARLAGRPAAVLCQNSGLGNLANALTSLTVPYKIPVLLIIGWRGRPGHLDEPQHRLMGRLTRPFLKACGVEVHVADAGNADHLAETRARSVRGNGASQAILIPSKLFRETAASRFTPKGPHAIAEIFRDTSPPRPTRREALTVLLDTLPRDAAVIAPTGLASRELCALSDSASHFRSAPAFPRRQLPPHLQKGS